MPASRSVLAATLTRTYIEGPRRVLPASERIAVVASFGASAAVSTSLEQMVMRLEECGYVVVVSRASDDIAPLQWSPEYTGSALVIRKPNIGYDFGSWAVALEMFPQIRRSAYVLLVNDSLVGPFASLAPLVADFEAAHADVWAATNTTQFFPHIQSFFMGFLRGVLDDAAMKFFWRHLQVETDKSRIIHQYELGLSRFLFGEAYAVTAGFQAELVVEPGLNPSVWGWNRLLELGFPFVKRELIANPSLVPNGRMIPAEVLDRFGVDPRLWT
jgi:lipopolysaccharide biosynthesis protein